MYEDILSSQGSDRSSGGVLEPLLVRDFSLPETILIFSFFINLSQIHNHNLKPITEESFSSFSGGIFHNLGPKYLGVVEDCAHVVLFCLL